MPTSRWLPLVALLSWGAVLPARAVPIVDLGAASSFAILAGTTVTNTGPSIIVGNVGLDPGSAVVGFPPGSVIGSIFISDGTTGAAQASLTAAYNQAAGLALTQTLTGMDLGGLTLNSGVYRFGTSAALGGILTLDGQNNPDANFVFQIGTSFDATSAASAVLLINGANANQVFFQVGSSATLSAGSFQGNILAFTSISALTGVNIGAGRLLARGGAVTLDSNRVSLPLAAATVGLPELDAATMRAPLVLICALLLLLAGRRRRAAADLCEGAELRTRT